MHAIDRRIPLALAVVVLGLALVGAAFAQHSTGATQANVTILDGKIKVTPASLTAGKLTFVAVNKGNTSHAFEIMGTGLKAKRTPTIAIGKTAMLTVTLKAGTYQIWDPLKSTMSHATKLVIKASASGLPTGSGSTGSGSTGSTSTGGTGSTGGTTSPGGGTTGGIVCDHVEVGTDCG